MWIRSVGAALWLAGCYAPTALPGAPCDNDEHCPSDQRCAGGSCAGEVREPLAAPECRSTEVCAAARTLGTVSGDTPTQALTATGYTAAWLRVRVSEDLNDSVAGQAVRVAAKLTVPASVDFDIFLYANVATEVVECATTIGIASTTGDVKLVRASWGEGAIANGVGDGRDVSIEIRPVAGTCAPEEPWQLTVEGNWH